MAWRLFPTSLDDVYLYKQIGHLYLGHPWDTFSCPDPQKLSFHSFWRFSRPRSKVHALSDSRTVFHVLLAKLRSNYVHIAFELRSNYVQLRSSCARITMSSFESALWKAVPDNNSCPTFQQFTFSHLDRNRCHGGAPGMCIYIYIHINICPFYIIRGMAN